MDLHHVSRALRCIHKQVSVPSFAFRLSSLAHSEVLTATARQSSTSRKRSARASGGCSSPRVSPASENSSAGAQGYGRARTCSSSNHTSCSEYPPRQPLSTLISSVSPYRRDDADMVACALVCVHRIATTIIAPTPLIAANFVILGQIIRRMGQQYSRISAKWCA